jgi:hypothetical protein
MDASLCIVGAFEVEPRNRMALEHSELMVVKLVSLPSRGEVYNQLVIKKVICLIVNLKKRVIFGNGLRFSRFIGFRKHVFSNRRYSCIVLLCY